jgi:hypothetical protein
MINFCNAQGFLEAFIFSICWKRELSLILVLVFGVLEIKPRTLYMLNSALPLSYTSSPVKFE